jgi:hypothetical protein
LVARGDRRRVGKLEWDDPEILSQVVEMRFLAAHSEAANGNELWSRYFAPTVKGVPTRDYIVSRILPRPRDIVYLVKGAISMAVNRGHNFIEEIDVIKAEYEYSRYAIDSIMVKNSITLPELENVLYEFAGARVIVTEPELKSLLLKVGIPAEKHDAVIEHLLGLSFLGMEVAHNQYVYSDEPREHKKHLVLSSKLMEEHTPKRYQIHPAFRSYLEVREN